MLEHEFGIENAADIWPIIEISAGVTANREFQIPYLRTQSMSANGSRLMARRRLLPNSGNELPDIWSTVQVLRCRTSPRASKGSRRLGIVQRVAALINWAQGKAEKTLTQ